MPEDKILEEKAIDATKRWLQNVVIGLGLCPFASKVVQDQQVAFYAQPFDSLLSTLEQLQSQAAEVVGTDNKISTSLLILYQGLEEFESYLDAYHHMEEAFKVTHDGILQMASFHPNYTFEDADTEDDITNYTNRSPYPIMHILKVQDVSEAIDSHPDIHNVGPRNKNVMRKLGLEGYYNLLG